MPKLILSLIGVLWISLIGVAAASHSADLNGDGKVDAADLTILKSQWRSTGTADLNHDGAVNARDAGILFSSWGAVPTPPPVGTNIALSQPVTTSSVETTGFEAPKAVDGSLTSRWSSLYSDPQWLQVDLRSGAMVNRVILRWEAAYGKSYQLQTSADGSTWTTIYTTATGDGGTDDITVTSTTTRYLRFYGTQRGTPWGYSLWELEVYGTAGTSTPSPPPPATSPGPLRLLSSNPRYFTDGSGKAVYLTGSHTWAVLQSTWRPIFHPAIDFTTYLNFLQQYKHNFIRLWVADTAWNDTDRLRIEPQPFVRTGPGNAIDGNPKFDLNRLNQAYFDTLRSYVLAARERGIYVAIMLFDDWGVSNATGGGILTWRGSPFHASNNINGINGDPNGDGIGIETHSLANPAITSIQEAYVRKVIDTVNDLDNVLYEISNESRTTSVDWQYHLIRFIRSYEATKSKQHPVGMTTVLDAGNDVLFNSPADWISPRAEPPNSSDVWSYNPPAATGAKVILPDTDHLYNNAAGAGAAEPADRVWVWRSFLRGHNPIYMDPIDFSQPNQIRGLAKNQSIASIILSARANLGYARSYASRVDLAAMTPSTSLCSTTYCLANAGSEYLVYAPSGGSFTVNLVGATYSYEWFNPATGSVAGTGSFSAGTGNRSFTPPFSGDAVLYLKRQ